MSGPFAVSPCCSRSFWRWLDAPSLWRREYPRFLIQQVERGPRIAAMEALVSQLRDAVHDPPSKPETKVVIDALKAERDHLDRRITHLEERLNSLHNYMMAFTGTGLFILRERIDGADKQLSDALSLDDFVRLVDSMGPKKIPRITKSEAAFMKQLVKKDNAP